jgi:hypothetical protein
VKKRSGCLRYLYELGLTKRACSAPVSRRIDAIGADQLSFPAAFILLIDRASHMYSRYATVRWFRPATRKCQ